MEIRQLNFDVARGGVQHRLSVCVGDTKSRTVTARFFSGGEPVPLTAAYLRGLRADGEQIYAACAVSDGAATYTFATSDLSVGGTLMCEFDLHNGDAVMTSPRFAVLCGKPLYTGEGAAGSNEYAAYIAALLKLENLTVTAEAGEAAAATATVGDTAVQLHFVLPKGDTGAKGDKGDKGDPGEKGDKGDPGADGKTPVKGADYWTPTEAAEIDAAKTAANNAADNASVAEAAALNAASAAYEAASSASISAQNADTAAGEARAKAENLQAKADAGDFNGADGYTPVRGTDYWTDADKAAINADIAAQVAGKVDKIDGKGLSTNDYTDADKAAVAKIPLLEKAADLLFTTTFEAETTAWNLTKIDGNAFALTSALVEFICPAAAASANINLGVYGADISQYYQVAGGIKTTPNNSSVYAACENGIGIVMVRNTGTNSTKTQTNASIGVIPLLKNIVRLYSGSTFPAGTTINVYGKKFTEKTGAETK